jgi:hypothetical protein
LKGSSTVLKASGESRDSSLSQPWQGDEQLEALVRELEQLATTPASKKRKRDPVPLDQVLGDIIALTYADARALAEPSRMAALEL